MSLRSTAAAAKKSRLGRYRGRTFGRSRRYAVYDAERGAESDVESYEGSLYEGSVFEKAEVGVARVVEGVVGFTRGLLFRHRVLVERK